MLDIRLRVRQLSNNAPLPFRKQSGVSISGYGDEDVSLLGGWIRISDWLACTSFSSFDASATLRRYDSHDESSLDGWSFRLAFLAGRCRYFFISFIQSIWKS